MAAPNIFFAAPNSPNLVRGRSPMARTDSPAHLWSQVAGRSSVDRVFAAYPVLARYVAAGARLTVAGLLGRIAEVKFIR